MGLFSRKKPEPDASAQQPGPIVFPTYQQIAPMPGATINRYAGELPPEIIDMWRVHGVGLVGDGFLRVIDPMRLIADNYVYLRSGVPIFLTAMCDTIMYVPETGTFTAMKLRLAAMDIVTQPGLLAPTLARFGDPTYQRDVLESRHYTEAVARLGVPAIDEGFFYRLPLAMGGNHLASELRRGKAVVTQALLLQAEGPSLRAYGPGQVVPAEDYGH